MDKKQDSTLQIYPSLKLQPCFNCQIFGYIQCFCNTNNTSLVLLEQSHFEKYYKQCLLCSQSDQISCTCKNEIFQPLNPIDYSFNNKNQKNSQSPQQKPKKQNIAYREKSERRLDKNYHKEYHRCFYKEIKSINQIRNNPLLKLIKSQTNFIKRTVQNYLINQHHPSLHYSIADIFIYLNLIPELYEILERFRMNHQTYLRQRYNQQMAKGKISLFIIKLEYLHRYIENQDDKVLSKDREQDLLSNRNSLIRQIQSMRL